MSQEFVIDQVSWHTSDTGSEETEEEIFERFQAIAAFLDKEGLTNRKIAETVDANFALRSSDLTNDGLALLRKTYDRWIVSLDKGKALDDMSIFEKALKKMRQK